MKNIIFIITITLLYVIPVNANDIKEYTLDNGLKVIVSEDHKAPIATFQVWYKVGSKHDPGRKSGMSHLLEHMMFKGSKNYENKIFSRLIQSNGGIDNAFTTKDYTMYYETLPSNKIEIALKLEADRMYNLLLKEKDLKDEKNVVMEERRLRYEDDPQNSLYEEVVATAFKIHPYRNPVIGWMPEIKSITQKDLIKHYKSYYCPKNSFIVIVGDVIADEIFNKVKKYFSNIPICSSLPLKISLKEPQQKGEKRVYLKKEAKLPYILIAYHVPSFPHKDSVVLDVLSVILSGKSGRFYNSIVRREKIAIDVFAFYDGLKTDPYLFFIGGTVKPKVDFKKLEKALYKELEKLKNVPPTEKEVQKAKNQIIASFIMEQDSIFFQAELIGMFEILGQWSLKDVYLNRLREVTPMDVQAVVKKYFIQDNKTVGVLIPNNNAIRRK